MVKDTERCVKAVAVPRRPSIERILSLGSAVTANVNMVDPSGWCGPEPE